MERKQSKLLQKFAEPKSEILKNRLLKAVNISAAANTTQNITQQNVLLNNIRTSISSSMIVSSMQASQSSMPIAHNIVTPVKIHTSNSSYPLQLSTVHVPVQIPGSSANINVPVQLSSTTSVPLQLTTPTVSLPLQVSGTTSVPVQLPAGETISVPLQLPSTAQNIQLATSGISSMPIITNTGQSLHNSIIHVHMAGRGGNMDGNPEMNVSNSSQIQLSDGIQVKLNNTSSVTQSIPNSSVVQIPNSSSNSIQLTLPNSVNSGTVQLRGAPRTMPHVVYIQTPSGLKPVTNTEMISQASSSGNPPQIIVRRPVPTSSNIHVITNVNKSSIAPKISSQNKSTILTPANVAQPIVIQKPKNEKVMVPVSLAAGGTSKQTIAYLGSVKKANANKIPDSQSILIQNNPPNVTTNSNQKLYITPMNMPKIQNTKFILPVTLPATMASKGPIINLQIANGQIQNDPQGNITVMRDSSLVDGNDMPPLQPFTKAQNGKDNSGPIPQSPKTDKAFAISIPGSRVESTGEQEYSLSIPETNASMNDDVYTVSIADEDGDQREKSFTLSIPEKGKSLLNKNVHEKLETIPAPAILRRSNSDNSERKIANANLKRRISLCTENFNNKHFKLNCNPTKNDAHLDSDNNDDHRVPSLFCDEKLDKDLDAKVTIEDSDVEDYKESKTDNYGKQSTNHNKFDDVYQKDIRVKRESVDSALEDDSPGLIWHNGVAYLHGSALRFQTNEFGLMDLVENSNHEETILLDHTAKYHTPIKQRIERGGREKKPTSPEDLYRCDGCGCHGMAAEFITPNICSLTCQNDIKKTAQKKRERDRMELSKKRNKIRRLLMKKQLSESDLVQEDKVSQKHYDSTPAEVWVSENSRLKMTEGQVENEKYPWMCGKNGFSWMRYLEFCKAKQAPVKLFKDPFPYTRNGFKVSMRLEAIDPLNPSVFCVVSVAEVQGFRMRLHFDEYPEIYDFWVNADSVDIFPPGWCEKNGRTLRPPAQYNSSNFSWPFYLKQIRAVAAPKHLFPHLSNTTVKPNGFRTGMKLEAEDRKNNMVCVASIADILDGRLLITFDSWDVMYDCWLDITSPYIHPVGWAEENGIELTPPNFYADPEPFSWSRYLSETGASAAPARAFKPRPPHAFKEGMKLEVVDRRVPFLIRVASVAEVKGHQVKISIDGWPNEFDYWTEDDSTDIHPVGWCLKTGHPLEPPLTAEEQAIPGPCGVGGCRGLGSRRGGPHKQHGAASACPYRSGDGDLPPRLGAAVSRPIGRPAKSTQASTPTSDTVREKLPRGRPPKHKRVEEVTKTEQMSDSESVSVASARPSSRHALRVVRAERHAAREERHAARAAREERHSQRAAHAGRPVARRVVRDARERLGLVAAPQDWTESETASFVSLVAGAGAASRLRTARVSGAELVMVSADELVRVGLRLGPAVKVHAAVRQLRGCHRD